ncbi:hypothetical protein L6R49_29295 [Myxococcota bacterium]|nr:hypothetical protein [Myxococcota bacterium]
MSASPSEQAAAVLLRRLQDRELRRVERARAAAHLAKLADGILSAHAPVSLRAAAHQWAAKASAELVKVGADVERLVTAQRTLITESCDELEWARAAAIWCAALEELLRLEADVLARLPADQWREWLDEGAAVRASLLGARESRRGAA